MLLCFSNVTVVVLNYLANTESYVIMYSSISGVSYLYMFDGHWRITQLSPLYLLNNILDTVVLLSLFCYFSVSFLVIPRNMDLYFCEFVSFIGIWISFQF